MTTNSTGAFGLLERVAAIVPNRVALIEPFAREVTFAEWLHGSLSVASRLAEAGITKGMRVGLLFDCAHWIDLCIAYFAVQRVGAVSVTVSAKTPASVRRLISQDAEISAWITSDSSSIEEGSVGGLKRVFTVELLDSEPRELPPTLPRPEDMADILYTSGTTGLPKAVVTPHGLFEEVYSYSPSARGGVGPPILHSFPVGTAAALMMMYAPFQGIDGPGLAYPITRPVAALPEFATEKVCRSVSKYRVNLLFLTPAMLAHLTRLTAKQRDMLTSLEVIHCGSAPLNPDHVERLVRSLPAVRVVNAYGTTETWPAMVETPSAGTAPDIVGRPVRGTQIRVRSLETGLVIGPDVGGRVEMSCPRFHWRRSYLHDEMPSKTFLEDGWTATGDIGHLDQEGYLHLSDRISDVLNVGGEKIPPRPVEFALLAHPLVESAAVFGLPHPRLGEYVAAVVVLREEGVSLGELRVHLLDCLPANHVPRRLFSTRSMPLTENGKVLKKDLKDAVARADDVLSEIR